MKIRQKEFVTHVQQIERYLESPTTEALPIWLRLLKENEEPKVNFEHLQFIEENHTDKLIQYVYKTLKLLDERRGISKHMHHLLSTTLAYSEVAKGGTKEQRKKWREEGYNLLVHNEASADIFFDYYEGADKEVIYHLIRTHGLIGQYLRGESQLNGYEELMNVLVREGGYTEEEIGTLLVILNYCVIAAVSQDLWKEVELQVYEVIEELMVKKMKEVDDFETRMNKLTKGFVESDSEKREMMRQHPIRSEIFEHVEFWYVEPAVHAFHFEDVWSMFQLIEEKWNTEDNITHLHFGKLMRQIHYNYKGEKHINIYKKRIIEKYLKEYRETGKPNETHVQLKERTNKEAGIKEIFFDFSDVGEALINFCLEAEKVDMMHSKATIMLFDFFGLRQDSYDRFHNEKEYLNHMNSAADDKKVILDYIKGTEVLDVGPGGGVMLDMIETHLKDKGVHVTGIDISQNVIDSLLYKKKEENKSWSVVKGDALQLTDTFPKESLDTIIYSSIIHELFSYIEWEGFKFNKEVVEVTLKSAYDALKPGGRIIIRDGVMMEEKETTRIIRFKDEKGMSFLESYTNEFKGRNISYEVVGENEVSMLVNDAMEFLYTYTWGEESFPHEVQEQFGLYTPNEYEREIKRMFGEKVDIIQKVHYLQEGYPINLKDKIAFMDEDKQEVSLPDSTLLLVIEKKK